MREMFTCVLYVLALLLIVQCSLVLIIAYSVVDSCALALTYCCRAFDSQRTVHASGILGNKQSRAIAALQQLQQQLRNSLQLRHEERLKFMTRL